MKIEGFKIKNFKGIKDLNIEISGDVTTLVGLNESGKTTILEALSYYVTRDKDVSEVIGRAGVDYDIHDIIPKSKNASFNEHVSVQARVLLDDDDVEALRDMYEKDYGFKLDIKSCQRSLSVNTTYKFLDSKHDGHISYWNMNFPVSFRDGGKYKKIKIGENISSDAEDKKRWLSGVDLLQKRHPTIAYFPTFIFDFPDRIYLKKDNGTDKKNQYYQNIIQDILDNHGGGMSVDTHILERIERVRAGSSRLDFSSKFSSSPEKRQIDSVVQVISTEMSNVIFGSWNNIFGKKADSKRLQLDWQVNSDLGDGIYIEISIVDGISIYSLSERSLGFRWFFAFLLFTQFRKSRKQGAGTIFLFDEPAANLHSKAQMKLLESFSKIAGPLTRIIYSTHSHYMINPLWLESAYVIRNKSADAEIEVGVESFSFGETDIQATKYRAFVGSYPNQVTYFQPVLDALDIGISPLVGASNAIIVEGKFDYHPIIYLRRRLGKIDNIGVYPVNGAGNAGRLINLFRGWGINFRIILDDDAEGRKSRQKYIDDHLLAEEDVVTIGDIDGALSGRSFEYIYKDDVINIVKDRYNVDKPSKRQYSLLFQELLGSKDYQADLKETLQSFEKISAWIDQVLLVNSK